MIKAIVLALFAQNAFAQSVNVKDINAADSDSTTIEIRKGEKALETKPLWEVVDGDAEVLGEHMSARKEARDSWRKACDTWKKELRDDNRDNKILTLNCGSPKCHFETEGTLCKSQAKYKLKTKLN